MEMNPRVVMLVGLILVTAGIGLMFLGLLYGLIQAFI